MVISVGYRVKSTTAIHFRQWATQILKEYIKKGFVLDDERLKQKITIILMNYQKELGILEVVKKYFIVKYLIYMQQVLTMILK